jgi:putative phage-type endonuclease
MLSVEDVRARVFSLTTAEAAKIGSYTQGSAAWLQSRENRLTASNFGAAVNMNKYCSATALLKDMLWKTFQGNEATRWGSDHESGARDAYVASVRAEIAAGTSPYRSIDVEESGLFLNAAYPWLGCSPDGVVTVETVEGDRQRFLLEIKCPFSKRFYEPNPVPLYYNCQIQGCMALMNLPFCDFVVWVPGSMQITRVHADPVFWAEVMLPRLEHFYFQRYLPAFVEKSNGTLSVGRTTVSLDLDT